MAINIKLYMLKQRINKLFQSRHLIFYPIVLGTFIILIHNVITIIFGLLHPEPNNPWEAAIIVEAWRNFQGLAIYEDVHHGHATHMYGPFVTFLIGFIFHITGPNNYIGRLISLVSALLIVSLLSKILLRRQNKAIFSLGWILLFCSNTRVDNYFIETRPDLTALFFSLVAILLMYLGYTKQNFKIYIIGVLSLVIGFFFKQTSIVFAFLPVVVLLLRYDFRSKKRLLLAFLPVIIMIGIILILRYVSPQVYYYMIDVPKQYPIRIKLAVQVFFQILPMNPLFLFCLGETLINQEENVEDRQKLQWIIGVLIITIPTSILAYSKAGGLDNSLLPAFLAMFAFCLIKFNKYYTVLKNYTGTYKRRILLALFLSFLVINSVIIPIPRGTVSAISYKKLLLNQYSRSYSNIIQNSKNLIGKVVCPEDPTIPMYAKGYAGGSIYLEKDSIGWTKLIPNYTLEEIVSSDYVIDVVNWYQDSLNESSLKKLGFVPFENNAIDSSSYLIWRKQ